MAGCKNDTQLAAKILCSERNHRGRNKMLIEINLDTLCAENINSCLRKESSAKAGIVTDYDRRSGISLLRPIGSGLSHALHICNGKIFGNNSPPSVRPEFYFVHLNAD